MTLLSDLKYITLKTVQAFKKNGINTVMELLTSYPSRFNDYTVVPLAEVDITKVVTITGIVVSRVSLVNARSNLSVMTFYVEVEDTKIRVSIFNRHFLRPQLHFGRYVRLTGKFDGNINKFTASEISFDDYGSSINPVFNIKGVDDKKVSELKERLFFEFEDQIIDDLPEDLIKEHNLISLKDAIRCVNIPEDIEETTKAIERIKFEELLKYQLKVKYMLYMRKNNPEGLAVNYDRNKVDEFIKGLKFELTPDQKTTIEITLFDMSSNYKMNRLLQGEVGSGKTIVSVIALYAAVTAGLQGAIMVPTEVLANQHYITFKNLFEEYNINIALLTSSIPIIDRKIILEDLENGKIDIIIGTHSLFQKTVNFNKLGLVVTDEEHRFGVRQRVTMVGKGYLIDHLKMSATPIPRTLAISLLGETDLSVIRTMPGNRKEVITKYYNYDKRQEVFEHIREEIKRGRQVYIITPMIDESELIDLNNATEVYENTKKYYQNDCNVGLIHGKLKAEEKELVMNQFINNEIQILIATSVIEVGVNVINATSIIILDADRFGIAQLHQMRGRVRRSDFQSYCFLLSKTEVESSVKRLKLIEEISDGFILAEEDLLIRGHGEIFGEKQTGNIAFKMADIVIDVEILDKVDKIAEEIVSSKKIFNEEYKSLYNICNDNYLKKKEILE